MIAHFLKDSTDESLIQRANQLGFQCREFSGDTIQDLSKKSWKSVYLVGFHAVIDNHHWSEIRQKLTLANRFYLVIGDEMQSSHIVKSMKDGAFDVILQTDHDQRWAEAISNAANSQNLWMQVYGGNADSSDEILLGQSQEMLSLKQNIKRLGPTDATVLITGESGAGKEKVAEALHQASQRNNFVAVNCAAIPKDLVESELFGAEKGAFTGAHERKGLVEQADNGTLFLDEIGELEIALQPKLLRFLETRTFRRVGSNHDIPVNIRVIAATNRQLEFEISRGNFRNDLYFRLSEISLKLQPLRYRKIDIPLFAKMFMEHSNERFGKNFDSIEPELIQKFQSYTWPGNVRELKSCIDKLVLMNFGSTLRAPWWDIPLHEIPHQSAPAHSMQTYNQIPAPLPPASYPQPHQPSHLASFPSQKEKLLKAQDLLASGHYNLASVAANLGIHPSTLYRWRKKGKV